MLSKDFAYDFVS